MISISINIFRNIRFIDLYIAAVRWWQILRNLCTSLMISFEPLFLMTVCIDGKDWDCRSSITVFTRTQWWTFLTYVKGLLSINILSSALIPAGGWHPQKDSTHHWHRCWRSSSQQILRISSGQRAAPEGVPLQAHPLPQEGLCPQEGRQHCK